MAKRLTHTDHHGKAAMVDVSEKATTDRRAVAEAFIAMSGETLSLICNNEIDKGDVLNTARLAGIMAAKNTATLIPLCHPLSLSHIDVVLTASENPTGIGITATVLCTGQTGVEMEALTAASVAALTIYDMAKSVDRSMTIQNIRLLEKSGGRSGNWARNAGATE